MMLTTTFLVLGIVAALFSVVWFMALMMVDTQASNGEGWSAVVLFVVGVVSIICGIWRLFQ